MGNERIARNSKDLSSREKETLKNLHESLDEWFAEARKGDSFKVTLTGHSSDYHDVDYVSVSLEKTSVRGICK